MVVVVVVVVVVRVVVLLLVLLVVVAVAGEPTYRLASDVDESVTSDLIRLLVVTAKGTLGRGGVVR